MQPNEVIRMDVLARLARPMRLPFHPCYIALEWDFDKTE